jgi:hypothetical protein
MKSLCLLCTIICVKKIHIEVAMSICMFQVWNNWGDFDEIWYECYVRGHPRIVLSLHSVGNYSIVR